MTRLTDKQQALIDEYLIDLNATQAGYIENRADATAYNLLRNTELKKAIQKNQNT